MTRSACAIAIVLFCLAVNAPVLGKNYQLHSPKLWTPQEKEQYEKDNPPVKSEKDSIEIEKQKEQQKKEKEQADKKKEKLKKERDLAEKQKEQAKKDKEQADKKKEQIKKELEQAEKQKERAKKKKEQAEKQKEQLKKEVEQAERHREHVKKEKEQAEKQKEQLKREMEQAEKSKEQVKKEKEQIEKQREQVKKEKEQIEKQKELVKKEQQLVKKEKEQVKKEKERIKKNQIQVKDGVSYREVTVQKGDTVYGIARKYSREGASYAETLRFNNIDDPDLIVSGDTIKVPLFTAKKDKKAKLDKPAVQAVKPAAIGISKPLVVQGGDSSHDNLLNSLTQPVVSKNAIQQKQSLAPNPPAELKSSPSMQTSLPVRTIQPFANNSTSSQKQYEVAIRSYRNGDCQMAIQQFTKFLAENTSSILAADASLFIADCYLRLSGK